MLFLIFLLKDERKSKRIELLKLNDGADLLLLAKENSTDTNTC